MSEPPDLRRLAALVPDEPLWVDLRGLLGTGRCRVWAAADPARGFVAVSRDYPFASLFGRPGAGSIREAVAAGRAAFAGLCPAGEWQLLAALEARDRVEAALPGWRRNGIVLHRWAGFAGAASSGHHEIRLLPNGHRGTGLALDHLPAASRREMQLEWVSTRPLAVAVVDSLPVAFCYAAFTTERLWDVSVETLAPYRRRGLAAACFQRLAAYMEQRGKIPAWGAMQDNPASLGLAAKLGFRRDAMLDGWFQEGGEEPAV